MITRRTMAFFAIAIICLTLNACKKSTDKNASCRIVTVTETFGSTTNVYNITYNNDGKISTIVSSGGSTINKVYTYSGNTIIINVTNSGSFYSRDSITLDARGRALNVRQYSNVAGTTWNNYAFEYSGDNLLKYQESNHTGGAPITNTVTTSGGNATSVQSPTATFNLEYHTDKGVQRGDYLELSGLLQYGVNVIPHKNLIKTIDAGGGNINNYNYEFNSDGLISKVTATSGSSSSTIAYQYACN